jgi:hypothetical protein
MGTIPLPVNQSFGGAGLAFGITHTGAGAAGMFRINNSANTGAALLGQTNGRGIAVRGLATSTTGRAGVFESTSGTGSQDVLFAKANNNGTAVHAVANGLGMAAKLEGVRNSGANTLFTSAIGAGSAISAVNTGSGRAGMFMVSNPSNARNALYAESNATVPEQHIRGDGATIYAVSKGPGSTAVLASGTNGNSPVLLAVSDGDASVANFIANRAGREALYVQGESNFQGNIHIVGTVSKSAGSFRIDHPLDPAHKYLSHSFVESPDMMNVYNGNASLDGQGEAIVMLPGYFEALNRDFRYQLTAVGAPGPNLYISQKIRNNRFVIAGGMPGAEVSWQVTGVRQDAYAQAHPIQVETDKPAGVSRASH